MTIQPVCFLNIIFVSARELPIISRYLSKNYLQGCTVVGEHSIEIKKVTPKDQSGGMGGGWGTGGGGYGGGWGYADPYAGYGGYGGESHPTRILNL